VSAKLKNPFNPQFGRRPSTFLGRSDLINHLISSYDNLNSPERTTIVSGLRGSGKTSLLSDVSYRLEENADWIVLNLAHNENLLTNILEMIIFKLEQRSMKLPSVSKIAIKTPLIDLDIKNDKVQYKSFYPRLLQILDELRKLELKLLIVIDEVNNSSTMGEFASTYQLIIREEYDVALLMAGLPQYVDSILNDKALTFLWRSNQIRLSLIDPYFMKLAYEEEFAKRNRPMDEDALDYAYLSAAGYPYLYQLIGYYLWEQDFKDNKITLQEVERAVELSKASLFQNVYSIIYRDLSSVEQKFLMAMNEFEMPVETKNVIDTMKKGRTYVNAYRERLVRIGVIETVSHGFFQLALPFFKDYLKEEEKRYRWNK
jgi:hypothetical protein